MTLRLDAASQAWFDAARAQYFPPERLQVGAHVTLFHALEGAREADVVARVAAVSGQAAPFAVEVAGLRFLGRGVAFGLRAPGAEAVRQTIAQGFALTRQDASPYQPHVTIQNKVAPEEAHRTQAALAQMAWPVGITAIGVDVWRYLGGPWHHLRACLFSQ